MSLKDLIKRNKLIFPIFLNIFRKNAGFHSDRIMRKLIKEIGDSLSITAFIETGTYRGDSSSILARNFPALPIFTCEVNKDLFELSVTRLKNYPNVKVFNQSSEKFLSSFSEKEAGQLPLFFLDAHWYDYWPLPDELKIINSKFKKAVIIVDDFKVPEREDIGYAREGSRLKEFRRGKYSASQTCDFNLVKNQLIGSSLSIIYPNYSRKESGTKNLFGYGIIFKNLKGQFSEFIKNPWIKNNFKFKNYD